MNATASHPRPTAVALQWQLAAIQRTIRTLRSRTGTASEYLEQRLALEHQVLALHARLNAAGTAGPAEEYFGG
jgi:hypothetical protein